MSYKVTITKIDKDVPTKGREYKVVGKKENGDDEYDYVSYDTTEDVTTQIFSQEVEVLDVAALVLVVNNLDQTTK